MPVGEKCEYDYKSGTKYQEIYPLFEQPPVISPGQYVYDEKAGPGNEEGYRGMGQKPKPERQIQPA